MYRIKVLTLCLALGLVASVNAAGFAQATQQPKEADSTHASRHADCPCCSMMHGTHQHSATRHAAAQTTGQTAQAKTDADGCCAGCADCKHDGASCSAMRHEGQKADGACASCKMGAHKSDDKTDATGAASDASCCKMHGAAGHDHAASMSGGHHQKLSDAHGDKADGCCCCAGDSCPVKKTEGR